MLILRHTGKGTPGKNGKDPSQAGRGSSAIDGRLSVQWLLQPEGEFGQDRSVSWVCTRNNDLDRDPPRPFNVTLKGSTFTIQEQTARAQEKTRAKESQEKSQAQLARAAIQDAWWTGGRHGISIRDAKDIAAGAGLGAEAGRRALEELVSEGLNPATRGPEYAYRLSSKGPVLWGVNHGDRS